MFSGQKGIGKATMCYHLSNYILSKDDEASRKLFACKISEKAYKMEKSIHISSPDKDYSKDLSKLLWSFKAESFLPHEIETKETKNNPKCITKFLKKGK